jgi:RNA polymerase sigma-70 factor (ECF subfamily)
MLLPADGPSPIAEARLAPSQSESASVPLLLCRRLQVSCLPMSGCRGRSVCRWPTLWMARLPVRLADQPRRPVKRFRAFSFPVGTLRCVSYCPLVLQRMGRTMKKLPATAGVATGLISSVPSQRNRTSTPGQLLERRTEFDEPEFLARLRCGEAQAYRALIRCFHGSLTRFATSIIGSRAQAEEVVQDTWLAVFSGIGAFEGRSSLVAWVFKIVLNRARTRVTREGRLVDLSSLLEGTNPGGTAEEVSEFKSDGHWSEASHLWDEISPERIFGGRQLWDRVVEAIDRLPSAQRAVITIWRDTEGCQAEDTFRLLSITAGNQRVLLHRARGRIRQTIDAVTGVPCPAAAATLARRRGGAASRLTRS